MLRPITPAQSPLCRRLRRALARELRTLLPAIRASAATWDAERYRKHFDSAAQLGLLLFHGLSRGDSLRQSYLAIGSCPGLLAQCGLAGASDDRLAVSFSQWCASNTSRPAAVVADLVPALAARARAVAGPHTPGTPPADLRILDTTMLRLSLRLARWLPPRKDPRRAGVAVLVEYTPALDLAAPLIITDTRANDINRLDQAVLDDPLRLASLAEQTLIMDLGFYSHARFQRLLAAGVHLVSRLHHQAVFTTTAEHPVQASLPRVGAGPVRVTREATITLGSPHNRAGAVLPALRLVEAEVAPHPRAARRGDHPITYRLITDRWDLTATEVVQCYLWRWEIEQCFRWLKRVLGVLRPLGTSRNAVELGIYLAIVVHLLCLLLARALDQPRRSLLVLALLPGALAHLDAADLLHPAAGLHQPTLPGWPFAATGPPDDG
jgi:hypothetical protein